MKKTCAWLKGALLGGLLGSALVLLLTPYSGQELTVRIWDYIDKVEDKVHQPWYQKQLAIQRQIDQSLESM